MVVKGEALLRAALSEVIGPADASQEDHIRDAANLAPIHLDSLDQRLLSGGAASRDVTLQPGTASFTWGPGGDIDAPVPAGEPPQGGVISWSRMDGGQEYAQGQIADTFTYQAFTDKETPGRPALLYRDRSGGGSRATFFVLPIPDVEYTLRLYGTIPALRTINRNTNYDLPDGVAAFVSLSLADYLVPHFALQGVPPGLGAKLVEARNAVVQSTRGRIIPRPEPGWMSAGRTNRAFLYDGF